MRHEEMKELKFSTYERDHVAIRAHLIRPEVERNGTLFQYLNLRTRRRQSAQDSAHARDQFAHAEWLEDIIRHPDFEATDDDRFGVRRADDDERRWRQRLQHLTQLDARVVGTDRVKENEIRSHAPVNVKPFANIGCTFDAEPFVAEADRQSLAVRRLCSDNEDKRALRA